MGHVVNYAYRLYERPEWTGLFGDINHPYEEEYRPRPFDPRYVVHLPGWYAQKHPDEDWAETFAVWMTPQLDWRARYAGRPALAKLEYCDRIMAELRGREPLVTAEDPDEDVGALDATLDDFYRAYAAGTRRTPRPTWTTRCKRSSATPAIRKTRPRSGARPRRSSADWSEPSPITCTGGPGGFPSACAT